MKCSQSSSLHSFYHHVAPLVLLSHPSIVFLHQTSQMMKPAASSKQTVLQRLSNLLFGREEERRYGGVVSQEAQEGQNLVSEALRILQPNVSLNYRLNFIKEFCEYIRSYRYIHTYPTLHDSFTTLLSLTIIYFINSHALLCNSM